jgi:uncharacterized protein YkwD
MAPTDSLGLSTNSLMGTEATTRIASVAAMLRQRRFIGFAPKSTESIASLPDRAGNSLTSARQVGSIAAGFQFSDAVHSRDRDDIFRIEVGQAGRINLSLTGLKADVDLELINARGSVVGRSTLRGIADERIGQDLAAGQYFVRVRQFRGDSRYTLDVKLEPKASEPVPVTLLTPGLPVPVPNPIAPTPAPAPNAQSFAEQVLTLTNQFRATQGLAPLRLNTELNAAADRHSLDMLTQDYFEHTGLNGSKPWDRARSVGYSASTIGENIAAGYGTAEAVVQGWINSPGHRANLLNFRYTEMGLGYSSSPQDRGAVNYGNYWTQMFGSGDTNPASFL